MNANGELSAMDKLLGLNWRTTLGAAFTGGGLALTAAVEKGTWHTVGLVAAAVGASWTGIAARDRAVTGAQIERAASIKQDAKTDPAFDKASAALPLPPAPTEIGG